MTTVPKPDESTLQGFGYRQELRRVLRTFAVFAVAFSIVSITTGIFLNYGFGITSARRVSGCGPSRSSGRCSSRW